MKNNKNKIFFISLAVSVIAGVVYYGYQEIKSFQVAGSGSESTTTGKHTIEIAPGVFAEIEGNALPTITRVPIESSLTVPNLDKPIKIPVATDTQSGQKLVNQAKELVVALKANPDSYENWLDLGIYRKMLNDYEGAEEIFVYLTKAAPEVAIAYINLGDLYTYYFHDNKKAEANFLKAVELAPRWLETYTRTVDFYVTVLNDKTKALKFLENSITKYPDMKSQLEPMLKNL